MSNFVIWVCLRDAVWVKSKVVSETFDLVVTRGRTHKLPVVMIAKVAFCTISSGEVMSPEHFA